LNPVNTDHPMINLNEIVSFRCGATMKNRFMLAPMTNTQSHEDGTLSDDEFHWLVMRAKGGFGLTMTCASHVQENGKGFPGQLGIFSDRHMEGHTRLAKAIQAENSLAVIQLHHAGIRSPRELVPGGPVGPSDDEKTEARGLSLQEVHQLRDDFIAAGIRAKQCGYDGAEIHGAHGYILCQFLSAEINHRIDEYGGSPENRFRLILEIARGIREACGPDFLLGLRLSPERFGLRLDEIKTLCRLVVDEELIDFLDISLWDCFKMPEESEHADRSLLEHFTALDLRDTRLTVAGKISTAAEVRQILDAGVDFVTIGRAAILHHDFPEQVISDPGFEPVQLPVTEAHLKQEGLGERFITYMKRWPGFVKDD
jgi:2,4-dienoyl-CoA reductase-like NADH-dependent reductase (Old Yellow Enzyme family)